MKAKLKTFIKSTLGAALRRSQGTHSPLSPTLWGLDYRAETLYFGATSLHEIAQTMESPNHLVMEERLAANYHDFTSTGLEVFLSYKTNPVPGVLGLLHGYGAGAEVISEYELWLANQLGVPPERIIYNGPAKSDASLKWAIENNILSIHINHKEEALRIRALAQSAGKKVRVGLRITTSGWSGQFGVPVAGGEALDFLGDLLKTEEFLVVSVHCHRGSSIRTTADVCDHLQGIADFVGAAKDRYGFRPEIIDIGGSLAVPTVRTMNAREQRLAWSFALHPRPADPAMTLTPKAYALLVRDTMHRHLSALGLENVRLVIEPGRSLTANTQMLLTRVMDVRAGADFDFAILDAGSCHARIMGNAVYQIFPINRRQASRRSYRLVGPICHPGDVLAIAWSGNKLQRGDALVVMDAGAYFIADSASFSFPRAGVKLLTKSGEIKVLQERESFAAMSGVEVSKGQGGS